MLLVLERSARFEEMHSRGPMEDLERHTHSSGLRRYKDEPIKLGIVYSECTVVACRGPQDCFVSCVVVPVKLWRNHLTISHALLTIAGPTETHECDNMIHPEPSFSRTERS